MKNNIFQQEQKINNNNINTNSNYKSNNNNNFSSQNNINNFINTVNLFYNILFYLIVIRTKSKLFSKSIQTSKQRLH